MAHNLRASFDNVGMEAWNNYYATFSTLTCLLPHLCQTRLAGIYPLLPHAKNPILSVSIDAETLMFY
jgi:hypothetical protein